jgi:hypothetical protein
MSLHAAIENRKISVATTVRIGASRVRMPAQHQAPRTARQRVCGECIVALILERRGRLQHFLRLRAINYLFVPPNHTVTEHNHAFGESRDARLVRHRNNRISAHSHRAAHARA